MSNVQRVSEFEKTIDFSKKLPINSELEVLGKPKLKISKAIVEAIETRNLSVRQLAKSINMQHPQIVRVTSGSNYNIDTLLKILNGLNLEIIVKKKDTTIE